MEENVNLKIMRCPTCGAPLKAENSVDVITCVYCGNAITPVNEAPNNVQKDMPYAFMGGSVKVEGIKTSSSALAYIEQLFEEYDWDAFAYAQNLTITQIDELVDSLKVSSADDKNTWVAGFKAMYVPFIRKVAGCKQILSSLIDEYKDDNLDAYSKFDAYKRIAAMILDQKDSLAAKLEKFAANAQKYGATAEEIKELMLNAQGVKTLSAIDTYAAIEQIPEIEAFIRQKNEKIAQQLAAKGINAQQEYIKAKELVEQKRHVEALHTLLSLEGYSDSATYVEKIDKYFLIEDVLEINGKLYYFKKANAEDDTYDENTYDLHPAVQGKILERPLIKNILKIITNYADILYYLDGSNILKKYDLSTLVEEQLGETVFSATALYVYGRTVFMLESQQDEGYQRNIVQLDLATGELKTIVENVRGILSLNENKLVYTVYESSDEGDFKLYTNIINVDTMDVVELGARQIFIEGFVGNYVVYTQESPNNYNKNLYIKALNSDEPEKLIEKNIFKFCDIIADKLFYYIGNTANMALININCDGTDRKEWPLYISKVLFEQGGWLYFIRRAGYNSVLCKSRLDGSKFSVIAADIEEFVELKNGYLYYINDCSALVKVRMDGSNLQKLCDHVEKVLTVKEDKIVFISLDDRIKEEYEDHTVTKNVKSIYAVDFSGSGRRKLAYNIRSAQKYDDNKVYYVATQEIKGTDEQPSKHLDILYKLDVETNQTNGLLGLEVEPEEKESNGFAIAMVVAVIAFFLGIIGLSTEAIGLGTFCFIAGFIALMTGLVIKSTKKT